MLCDGRNGSKTTYNFKEEAQVALSGELALEVAVNLSQD